MVDLAVQEVRSRVAQDGLVTRSATRTNIRLLTLPVLVVVVLVLTAVAASTHQAVHEAWHGNLYRSLRANNLVGTVLVTPLGLNYAQHG